MKNKIKKKKIIQMVKVLYSRRTDKQSLPKKKKME